MYPQKRHGCIHICADGENYVVVFSCIPKNPNIGSPKRKASRVVIMFFNHLVQKARNK